MEPTQPNFKHCQLCDNIASVVFGSMKIVEDLKKTRLTLP